MSEALKRLLDCWIPDIRAVVLVCACCLLSVASYGQIQAPTESGKNQKPQAAQSQKVASEDQRGTEKLPLIIKVIPTTKSEDEAVLERQDREDRTTNERLLIYATILLALFTCILAFFTAKLWWEARQTAERQLRAYVSVHRAEITGIDGLQTPVATISIKNYGQTPAYGVTQMGGIALGDSFDTLPPPTGPKEMTNAGLPPGGYDNTFQSAPRPLSVEESASLRAGTKTLWVYGEIHYRDAFKIKRFTKYRFMIGGHVRLHGNNLAICQEGNESN